MLKLFAAQPRPSNCPAGRRRRRTNLRSEIFSRHIFGPMGFSTRFSTSLVRETLRSRCRATANLLSRRSYTMLECSPRRSRRALVVLWENSGSRLIVDSSSSVESGGTLSGRGACDYGGVVACHRALRTVASAVSPSRPRHKNHTLDVCIRVCI